MWLLTSQVFLAVNSVPLFTSVSLTLFPDDVWTKRQKIKRQNIMTSGQFLADSDEKSRIYMVTNFGCWWQFNLFCRDRNQICQNYLWGRHSNMPNPFRTFPQILFQICQNRLEHFHKEKDKKLKLRIPKGRKHRATELHLNWEKYNPFGKTRKNRWKISSSMNLDAFILVWGKMVKKWASFVLPIIRF